MLEEIIEQLYYYVKREKRRLRRFARNDTILEMRRTQVIPATHVAGTADGGLMPPRLVGDSCLLTADTGLLPARLVVCFQEKKKQTNPKGGMKFTIGVLHYIYLQYGWINEPELKLSKSNKNKQNESGLILVEGDVLKLLGGFFHVG